jgi:eukaryotic-like serine/threonine-protein kinase
MKVIRPARVRLGIFELDLRSGELCSDGQTVLLREQPLQVLRMLVEREGELVSREEIRKTLWPNDTIVEFDHSINSAIKNLRRALGDSADNPKYIETLARRGYRLMVPVERITPTDDSSGDINAVGAGPALRLQPDLSLIGRKVSHYRVLEIIGGGGMGLVYKAEDLKLGRQVALKFLPEELASDTGALQRFEREARTASSLDHPNICTIYEVEEHEGQPFIVMQLLRGETLRDRLATFASRKKTLSFDELLDIAVQMCTGLEAAHAEGIIHRDIKPANVFLTTSGQVKILDFGVAKLVEVSDLQQPLEANAEGDLKGHGFSRAEDAAVHESRVLQHERSEEIAVGDGTPEGVPLPSATPLEATLTRTGAALGTAGYMSPEQIRGEKLDARTDIFSFGLVLYEMATGHRAFGGETQAVLHEAILTANPVPAHDLNSTLPPKLCEMIGKALEKDRERRYQTAADLRTDLQDLKEDFAGSGRFTAPPDSFRRLKSIAAQAKKVWVPAIAVLLFAALIAGALYYRAHRAMRLTEKDTVVLADFVNSTGDAVFNDSLKTALSVSLGQSPFLHVLSSRKVATTLQFMTRPPDTKLTPDVARELCLRAGSKAYIAGAIASLGNEYALWLNAVNCQSGKTLAQEQVMAASKDNVLRVLGEAASKLRGQLGESLASVQEFDAPLAQVTTPSLEALEAYSKASQAKSLGESIALNKRAIELDPKFAMAYNALSGAYENMGQSNQSIEYAKKAFELREHLPQRERFDVAWGYYCSVTNDVPKANEVAEAWVRAYPTAAAYADLSAGLATVGQWEKALAASIHALQLAPGYPPIDFNVVSSYMALNRFQEAGTVLQQALARKEDGEQIRLPLYVMAFLQGDAAGMQQQVAWAAQQPKDFGLILAAQAATDAYYGRIAEARNASRRAAQSAVGADAKEDAATWQAAQALWDAEFGDSSKARSAADEALRTGPATYWPRLFAAVALSRAGQVAAAQKLADALAKEYPSDTQVQGYYLPVIRASMALTGHHADQAIKLLQPAAEYELGRMYGPFLSAPIYPAYVRGLAFLMAGNGQQAAGEFQKLIDHRGIVQNLPVGALARLQLGRAYAMAGDRAKAKAAYQDFLTLWKGADPDIPIYKQAKAEYAKLE